MFLPPNSLNMYQIDVGFTKLKTLLRKDVTCPIIAVWNLIGDLLDQFSPN